MFWDVLEPFLTFLVAVRSFTEVSLLTVVSRTLNRMSLSDLSAQSENSYQVNLSGFPESVDEVVCLTLLRVTSENLRVVNQSACRNISAGVMEDVL
jgi:hypothetical protein